MVLLGAALLYRSRLRRLGRLKSGLAATPSSGGSLDATPLISQRVAFVSLLAFCLTIPRQLDPRHPVQVWRAAPGAGVLLAVSHDRYRAAGGACRHGGARSVLPSVWKSVRSLLSTNRGQDPRADWHPARYDQPSRARSLREELPGMRPAVAMENGQR